MQIPRVTPHWCRHTCCTNMVRKGINPKALQYLMGHSNIGITMNIYANFNNDDAQKAWAVVEQIR